MTIGVTVLGSTGSVGINTLDVIARNPDCYHVCALSAHKNVELVYEQCLAVSPSKVAMACPDSAQRLAEKLSRMSLSTEVVAGHEGLDEIAASSGEIVVCGIVGAAGLLSTLAAVKSGKKVLIANKEPLVMLGEYIMELAAEHEACLLPLDSEHNAIFQCLPRQELDKNSTATNISQSSGVKKILLTGSGGPFRTTPLEQFSTITPDQACRHPNWSMGRKISVDSATMMNKGLELIEACMLFGVEDSDIEIVIHPQSVIHSMVEYIDGSVLAQLGSPDMRVPIAHGLAWPNRILSGADSLDLIKYSQFDFEQPDEARFRSLVLAREAAKKRGSLPTVMNAANEIAVEAFLTGRIQFPDIMRLVEDAMSKMNFIEQVDLESVLEMDECTRRYCLNRLSKW